MSRHFSLLALPLALMACGSQANNAQAPAGDAGRPFAVTVIADLESPWAMTFLPDGRLLVTEKRGKLLLLTPDDGKYKEVSGIPPVDSSGQGGLMDVVLHPKFAENHWVYFSYSSRGSDGKGVVLSRGRLVDGDQPALTEVTDLFRATPFVSGNGHYSGRIAFAPDGHLFFTNGERQKFDPAQDPKATLGKVLRLNDDGTPVAGNPLAAKGFHPAVWSYGHRNLLGIAFDAAGNLWEQEMGPEGGDEVNLILPGRNYGYPRVSNGDYYGGAPIPDHRPGDGFEAPKVWWNPSISRGGLMIYSGSMFPQWKGDAFLGGLSGQALIRVHLDGTNATKGDQWDMGTRIREAEQGPDGAIWLIEDGTEGGQGKLMKLTAPSN